MEFFSKSNNRYVIIAKFANLSKIFKDTVSKLQLKESVEYIGSKPYITFVNACTGSKPISIYLYITSNIIIQCYPNYIKYY